jgi:hypothetical protein
MKRLDLPDSLRDGRLEYKLLSKNPIAFGWVLTLAWEPTPAESEWLANHGLVQVRRSWFKRERCQSFVK